MSGLFDFFNKKPEQKSVSKPLLPFKSSLPSLPSPSTKPTHKEEQQSIFAIFKPQPQLPARVETRKPSPFNILAPKNKPRAETAPRPKKPMIRFPEAQEEKGEVRDIFKEVLKPEAPPPPPRTPTRYTFLRPSNIPQTVPIQPYGLPAPATTSPREWPLPTPTQMAERFHRTMNLPAMWDEIRSIREMPEFRRDQAKYYKQGAPMMVPVDPVVYQEVYTDFANFYGIPWEVMTMYLDVPASHQKEAEEALWDKVLSPLNAMVPEAFEMLKPPDLPGFFNVSFTEPGGEYWLYYIEPLIEGLNILPGGSSGA